MGFMGRYCNQGDEFLLEQLKSSNLKLLVGSSVGIPSLERAELFPEARSTKEADMGPQNQKFRFTRHGKAAHYVIERAFVGG